MTQEILTSYWKSKAVLKWFYWRQFSEAQKMVRLLCRQIDWNYSILIVIWFCQKLYDQNWILALEIGGEIKFKVGVIPKWTLALVVKSHENHQCFVYSIFFYMISTFLTTGRAVWVQSQSTGTCTSSDYSQYSVIFF